MSSGRVGVVGRLVFVVSFGLLGVGCLYEASETIKMRGLIVDLDDFPVGQGIPDLAEFELRISGRDEDLLGTKSGPHTLLIDRGRFWVETKFRNFDESTDYPGPCLFDDVVVVNLDSGEEFVAFPSGYCIVDDWLVRVDGAYAYLDSP